MLIYHAFVLIEKRFGYLEFAEVLHADIPGVKFRIFGLVIIFFEAMDIVVELVEVDVGNFGRFLDDYFFLFFAQW